MKRVLVLATGGTIAAKQTENGLAPTDANPDILSLLQGMADRFIIDYRDLCNLDSSNIQPEEWLLFAKEMRTHASQYDGILLLHGTDTMAYTASMLSILLRDLTLPIVLTGSQIPMGEAGSDAPHNLSTALLAIQEGIGGVTVAFAGKVMAGRCAVKVRTMGLVAFESVNYPDLAVVQADGLKRLADYPSLPWAPPTTEESICTDVMLLKLLPGTNPTLITTLPTLGYRGLVIEAFGAGGIHQQRRDLTAAVATVIQQGMTVVVCSQCLYDRADLSIYEVGQQLSAVGVLSAGEDTTEYAVAKLMWALAQAKDSTTVHDLLCHKE